MSNATLKYLYNRLKDGTFPFTTLGIQSTTQSTDTLTGSVVTAGGIGIAKNANIGGNTAVTGTLSAANLTVGTTASTTNGSVWYDVGGTLKCYINGAVKTITTA